jgi:hypothetical protein
VSAADDEAVERGIADEMGDEDEDAAPDTGETDESAPEEVEPEAFQPPALTEAKIEAIFKALDRNKDTVRREVARRAEVMFDDLVECPLCMGGGPAAGFIFPVLPEPDNSLRRETIAAVLGGAAPTAYAEDEDTEECPRCHGLGATLTHSQVAGQETRPCPTCGARGWREKLQVAPPPPVFELPQAPPQPYYPQPGTNGAADPFGRPAGHPHYGIPPAMVGA